MWMNLLHVYMTRERVVCVCVCLGEGEVPFVRIGIRGIKFRNIIPVFF